MNYDPETFEVTLPYPDSGTRAAYRDKLQQDITNGILEVPREHLHDTKAWLDFQVKEFKLEMEKKYKAAGREALDAFRAHCESENGTSDMPQAFRDALWNNAWEHGHSYGISEVACTYGNFDSLIKAVRDIIKSKAK